MIIKTEQHHILICPLKELFKRYYTNIEKLTLKKKQTQLLRKPTNNLTIF